MKALEAPNPDKRIKGKKYKDIYTEGPWLHKRNGKYYLLYAAGGIPEHIAYSMGSTPWGPWKYMGELCRCRIRVHLRTIVSDGL